MKAIISSVIVTTLLWRTFQVVTGPENIIFSCEYDPKGPNEQPTPQGITADCAVLESDGWLFVRVMGLGPMRRKKRGPLPPDKMLIETSPAYDISDPNMLAEAGQDYEHVSFPYEVDQGYGFIVPIIKDDKVEGPELFQVNVYDLVDAFDGGDSGKRKKRGATHPLDSETDYPYVMVVIIDDDVSFRLDYYVYVIDEESRAVTFKVIREGKLDSSHAVSIRTEDITATRGGDYVHAEAGSTLKFTDAYSETAEGTIDMYCDFEVEGPEAFKVIISSTNEGVVIEPSEAVVIILDFTPTVPTSGLFTFEMNHYEVTEGNAVTIRVCRKGDLESTATIILQTNNLDAQSPNDYTGISNKLITFTNGADKSDPITIETEDDTRVEQQELFELALVSGNNKISTATVWIADDDVRYCFDSKVYVAPEGDGTVTLTIVKEGNLQDTSEMSVITSDIEASSPDDYTDHTSITSIPAGESTTQLDIAIQDDETWESTESFNVDIEIDGVVTCSATVLIKDDDELCDPACVNDGKCVGPDVCLCPFGFIGDRCESALCNPACNKGGTCVALNTCLCSRLHTGPTCETELCHQSCENGGICIEYTNTCWCPTGYTGAVCETSLCTSPCKNGGVCSEKGVCLCPSGFSGLQCQTSGTTLNDMSTPMIGGHISITSIDGAPAVFSPDLNIDGSAAREAVLASIRPLLYQVLGALEDVIGITFGDISPGSINIEYGVITPPGSQTNADDVNNAINTLQQIAPAYGVVINPDPSVTYTRDFCPDGYCKNGGTCMADMTGMRSVCTCTGQYTGSQCETRQNDSLSGGEIGGIIVGMIAFILLIILVSMCVLLYLRGTAGQGKAVPAEFPNLNTLDLASYPYKYPRINANELQNSMVF